MIRREELIADALALLHAHGHVPSIWENGGKHIKNPLARCRAALHVGDFTFA